MWTASAGIASISLSATFADRPARLKGLFNVLRIMEPAAFDKWLLERGHFTNQYNDVESLTALDDMKAINKILYPKYGYRVSYDDPEVKKHFPERVIQTEIVDLGGKLVADQNKAYEEMMVKAQRFKELGQQAQLMVADLRYRQYAELLKVKTLVEMVQDLLYLGKAVVVFVNFRETLRYLAEALKTKSMIFGDQERFGLSREEIIEDFQYGREKLILCTADAGGQSLDLHDVHGTGQRVSLICPTYNPITIQQVLGRTFRAGTKSTPVMKLVYAAGTIEEKVCDTVNRKLDNIAALNEGDLMEPDLFNLGVRL
jgi:SNF2 family DNA or RNA helicase